MRKSVDQLIYTPKLYIPEGGAPPFVLFFCFFFLLSTTGGFRTTTVYSYHKFWIFLSSWNLKHLLSLENIKILWKCKYFNNCLSEWIKSLGITDVWIYSVGSEWEFSDLQWEASCHWLVAPRQQGGHPWAQHWKVSSKCKLIIQRLVKKGLGKKEEKTITEQMPFFFTSVSS